jgi:hypothetical protein
MHRRSTSTRLGDCVLLLPLLSECVPSTAAVWLLNVSGAKHQCRSSLYEGFVGVKRSSVKLCSTILVCSHNRIVSPIGG